MYRQSPTLRRFSRRGVRIRRLTVILVLGVLGALGIRLVSGRATPPAPGPQVASPDSVLIDPDAFSELRPRAGDCMAPPRLGFRWRFDGHRAEAAIADWRTVSRASIVPAFHGGSDSLALDRGFVFRVHVVGAGGSPEVTGETDQDQVYVDLDAAFEYGECEWWVEAVVAGHTVLRSEREYFTLRP